VWLWELFHFNYQVCSKGAGTQGTPWVYAFSDLNHGEEVPLSGVILTAVFLRHGEVCPIGGIPASWGSLSDRRYSCVIGQFVRSLVFRREILYERNLWTD
jgi:hypothetical protein